MLHVGIHTCNVIIIAVPFSSALAPLEPAANSINNHPPDDFRPSRNSPTSLLHHLSQQKFPHPPLYSLKIEQKFFDSRDPFATQSIRFAHSREVLFAPNSLSNATSRCQTKHLRKETKVCHLKLKTNLIYSLVLRISKKYLSHHATRSAPFLTSSPSPPARPFSTPQPRSLTFHIPKKPAHPIIVSWGWGGAHPTGEVADKKTEGEASVTSKKGNVIKKKGTADDPAVAITREGNDVVKKVSELDVEEKNSAANGTPTKGSTSATPAKAGSKRTHAEATAKDDTEDADKGDDDNADDDDEDKPEKEAKRARGRPKGTGTPAKAKAATGGKRGRPAGKKEKPAPKAKPAPKVKETKAADDGVKKARGRPKKDEGAPAKPKAEKKVKERKAPNGTGVGSRTRSKN